MFVDPKTIVDQFELLPGMAVADLGAGSGFYTPKIARLVGDKGRVYAVDVQRDLVDRIKNAAVRDHLSAVEAVWGNAEKIGGTKLRNDSQDRVIASNLLFQVEDRAGFVSEIRRILKPKGKAAIIDWAEGTPTGPKPPALVMRESAKKLFENAGFIFEREFPAGDHHYGLIFTK